MLFRSADGQRRQSGYVVERRHSPSWGRQCSSATTSSGAAAAEERRGRHGEVVTAEGRRRSGGPGRPARTKGDAGIGGEARGIRAGPTRPEKRSGGAWDGSPGRALAAAPLAGGAGRGRPLPPWSRGGRPGIRAGRMGQNPARLTGSSRRPGIGAEYPSRRSTGQTACKPRWCARPIRGCG